MSIPFMSWNRAIRPPPVFNEDEPVKNVAAAVIIQVTLTVDARFVAVCASPVLDEGEPVEDVTGAVAIQVALAGIDRDIGCGVL